MLRLCVLGSRHACGCVTLLEFCFIYQSCKENNSVIIRFNVLKLSFTDKHIVLLRRKKTGNIVICWQQENPISVSVEVLVT